jgi:DNA-binding response OmpR family regulator
MPSPDDVTVLIVDDDAAIRALVVRILTRSRMQVTEAGDGRAALRSVHERRPDVVILDVGLPELTGWQVLERIRDVSDVPVLMLTGRTDHHDKVRGLDAGADDYVVKPFNAEELLARVSALLRRARTEVDALEPFTDGRLHVDFAHRTVAVDGADTTLTPIEYRLLATLVRHPGQTLSPEQLLEHAWDDPTGVGAERVKFAVMRLRRKLGLSGDDSPIETVRGFGYRYRAR